MGKTSLLGLLLTILVVLGPFTGATNLPNKKTPNKESASPDKIGTEPAEAETDDRINININRGHAVAYGAGGSSVSDSLSRGVLVGIRRPGMADQTLYQKSDSFGASRGYGYAPPTAWTGAHNQIAGGVNRGGATAGFANGAKGIAQTSSLSQVVEIPLDAQGTVMFSNLKEKKPHGGATEAKKSHHRTTLDMRPELSP